MSDSDLEGRQQDPHIDDDDDRFEDQPITCIDCAQTFIWSAGEQAFFLSKDLHNPPKRCKECKKAKNRRLEAIEASRLTGRRHKIEVRAQCALCSVVTTVPFYPCQGRPVYCRECFAEMKNGKADGAANS
ncbi:MAG: zinc-ribbon domain containing protein [Pyrinomonadaceae bacterium]